MFIPTITLLHSILHVFDRFLESVTSFEMNATVLVTFTIVMVTAMQSTSGVNLLTEKRRYCGRHLVSSLLKACGIGQFPQTGNARKREIGEYNGGQDKSKL